MSKESTVLTDKQIEQIIKRSIKLIGCDTARIITPVKTHFLIIGYKKNTKDDVALGVNGQWVKNGKPFDFDYIAEKVIASGETLEGLWESVKEYGRSSVKDKQPFSFFYDKKQYE